MTVYTVNDTAGQGWPVRIYDADGEEHTKVLECDTETGRIVTQVKGQNGLPLIINGELQTATYHAPAPLRLEPIIQRWACVSLQVPEGYLVADPTMRNPRQGEYFLSGDGQPKQAAVDREDLMAVILKKEYSPRAVEVEPGESWKSPPTIRLEQEPMCDPEDAPPTLD